MANQKVSNLYWSVYKNIEKEVLSLSDGIYFHEDNLSVYSVKIAELLIRCSVEIEAISKELYEQNGGDMTPKNEDGTNRDLFFDTDCLKLLVDKWLLNDKVVMVSSPNFYFQQDENKILKPLNRSEKRGKPDWKAAYQAVKHNRSKELKKANVKHIIRALAALYILNIYYQDNVYRIKSMNSENDFSTSIGSDLFSIKTYFSSVMPIGTNEDNEKRRDFNECVYLMKFPQSTYENIVRTKNNAILNQIEHLKKSEEMKEFIRNNPTYKFQENIYANAHRAYAWSFRRKICEGKTFEEQKKALLESYEYRNYIASQQIKDITQETIASICENIGTYSIMCRFAQYENPAIQLCLNSSMDIVLNKNQELYSISVIR